MCKESLLYIKNLSRLLRSLPLLWFFFKRTGGVDCKTHTRFIPKQEEHYNKSHVNNDQCLYFICGDLGTNMMTAGRKRRPANIMTLSISDTTSSCINTIQTDFAWSILYLYHLYYQISMSASVAAMLVTWLQIVPTLTALTTALVRKDTLGTDSHAKV